ncbi:MAG TPA: hypothetical protein VN838_25585 [Bradyrhizobium sp.]|nr:hypothetical protein [Bradyrhizobium sp.]
MRNGIVDIADPLGIVGHDHIIVGKNGHASLKGMKLIWRSKPATHVDVILRCSPHLAASLEGSATSPRGHPSRRRARARLLRMTV